MSSVQENQNTTPQPKVSASTTPPLNISPQAYLDPACYAKGLYPVNIEAGSVIHPRCRLYTDQGRITIRAGSVLIERCIIGFDKELNPAPEAPTVQKPDSTNDISIGPQAYLQSSVKIQPPCTIGEGVLIEAGVTIQTNCSIGDHSKICAGVVLPSGTIIPEGTVVYGVNGRLRRRRQENMAEDSRIEGISRERQGMELLLRANAAKTISSTGGGSRHGKRESVIRVDSSKT